MIEEIDKHRDRLEAELARLSNPGATQFCPECERWAQENSRLRNACQMVLLFHGGGVWTRELQDRWDDLVGKSDSEATTKVLCDSIRAALSRGNE
jgi:hypothetical protein